MEFLQCEEFLISDLRVDEERHFLFATPGQLRLLRQAKRWFMDGTFKIVGEPFKRQCQLMSIHAFVTEDGKQKQFPLAFALMFRKRKDDYAEVLRALKQALDVVNVRTFVLDFEKGAWQVVREVFLDVEVKGCVFHWTQAVRRHIQEYGLSTAYRARQGMHSYMRQLLALPFLPADHILPTFTELKNRPNSNQLRQLVSYIDRQWMSNVVFDIPSWSVYRLAIRTNNDVEGWHNRISKKAAHSGLRFYRLVLLLRCEAETVEISVAAEDVDRETGRRYTRLEERLREAWDRYNLNEITTTHFLKTCGNLYAPTE